MSTLIVAFLARYGITPDQVVAFFELVSGCLIWKSVKKLHEDKLVRGVSVWPITFFGLWGYWNIIWYDHIHAPWAWWCGINVVFANTTWALQMFYWNWREKHPRQIYVGNVRP